jgi:hypothetical protein
VGFLTDFLRKRALKRYARELPPRLLHDYGAEDYFTVAQIRTAVAALKLKPELISYAYAVFLSKDLFAALSSEMPVSCTYEEACAEFLQYVPPRTFPEDGYYESGTGYSGWAPQPRG